LITAHKLQFFVTFYQTGIKRNACFIEKIKGNFASMTLQILSGLSRLQINQMPRAARKPFWWAFCFFNRVPILPYSSYLKGQKTKKEI